MEFRILGPLEVVGEDGSLSLPKGRARSVLTLLVLNPGQIISIDRLIDLLWGASPPATSRTKLYGLISSLRKSLEPHGVADDTVIQTRPPGYVLDIEPSRVDAFRFGRLVETASDLPADEKAKVLKDALDLWRGPALADFTYEPFAQIEISSLEELHLATIEDWVSAELDLGRHAELVPELERLVAENPFRERLRAQAMLALYRSGSQQKALSVYRDAYNTLTEELGIEPGPELQDLEEAILRQDPALQARSGPVGVGYREETAGSDTFLSESRRVLTMVFIDLGVLATPAQDPEAHRSLTRRAHETISEMISRHGGTTQGSIGGVNVSVFGLPTAHEDDPLRAIRAAAEIMRALTEIGHPDQEGPAGRIGINTGEVVVGDTGLTDSRLPEDTVRVAAHLQQSAAAGEILLGDRTRQMVSHAATVEPVQRDIANDAGDRLAAWRLVSTDPLTPRPAAVSAPWVGREKELDRLVQAFRDASNASVPRRVTVVGAAGIGKSRLALEFAKAVADEARLLTGHCPPYGEGITFLPLREIVAEAAGDTRPEAIERLLESVDDADSIAIHVAGAIGSTETPLRPDVLFPSVRKFFETLALDRPLVLVIEDVHWAQPTFVELISYLTEFLEQPVMLLCLARPELVERHPGWADEGENVETLVLEPLETRDVKRLVKLTIAQHDVGYDRAVEVIDVAGGNPLFVHQLLAALSDNEELTIPPSIHALLMARLDRLGPAERNLMRAASVWGRRFEGAKVAELLPQQARDSAPAHLDSLERKELISRVGQDHVFSFRHALIQLVAYQTITKDNRARLHEQVAGLLDGSDGDSGGTDEVIGYHLEQAFGYRLELGIDDDHNRGLAERAGGHLFWAGRRAFGRFDAIGAQNLFRRAVELLPTDHPDRWNLKRYLVETHQVMGQHDQSERAIGELIDEMSSGDNPTLEHFLRLEQVWARIAIGPDPMTLSEIEKVIRRARKVFEAAGDEVGLTHAALAMTHIHLWRGQMAEMEKAAKRGKYHADRSTSSRGQLGARLMVAITLEEGPRPVEECIELCEEHARWHDTRNPPVVSSLSYFWAMSGDFDKARELAVEARTTLKERVRARRPLGQMAKKAADVELLAGDFETAEKKLREALEVNCNMGEDPMISPIAATLSGVLVRRGDVGGAKKFADMSRDHAPSEMVTSQALWRAAQARILSLEDAQTGEAQRLAEEAERMVPTEMLTLKAEVTKALGEVLLNTGDRHAGTRAIRRAIDLFERKGNVAAAGQARGIIG